MSILTNSPSPNKSVYVPRPYLDTDTIVYGRYAADGPASGCVADGELRDDMAAFGPAAVQYYMPVTAPRSLYPVVEAPVERGDEEAVEIDGRAWQVVDRMTAEELERTAPRAAEVWQRAGRVVRVELRLARGGRRSYLADRFVDGSYSRPWRGTLTAAF